MLPEGRAKRAVMAVMAASLSCAAPLHVGACQGSGDPPPEPVEGSGPTLIAHPVDPWLTVRDPHRVEPGAGTGEESGDPVVAWVNDAQILRSHLDAAMDRRLGGLRGSRIDRTPALRNRERRRVVEQLVEREMLLQFMREQGINVSDEAVDAALQAEIESVFHGSEHFERYLSRRHLTREEFRQQKRFDMQLEQVIALRGGAEATEEEVQAYYEQHRESWRASERVLASCITVRLERDAPEVDVAAAISQLEALRASIGAAELTFEEAARQHSQSPDRFRGGDMGWVYRDDPDLDPLAANILFTLPIGAISEPVRTMLGVQLFWSRDHRPDGYREFDEVRDSLDDVVEQREEQALRASLVHELEQRFDIGYNEEAFGLEPE